MTEFALRVLRDDADHDAALEELERLWGAPDGTPEADRLGVLTLLIDDYERRAHALELPDPIDAILFRMEAQGLTRRDLERFIGSSGRVSEVLSRKRGLSIEMIRRLHSGLGIPLDVLVQPTGAPETAAESRVVEVVPLPAEVVQVAARELQSSRAPVHAVKSMVAKLKKAKAKKGKHHRDRGSVTISYVVPHSGGGWVVSGQRSHGRLSIEEHELDNIKADKDASDRLSAGDGEDPRLGDWPT